MQAKVLVIIIANGFLKIIQVKGMVIPKAKDLIDTISVAFFKTKYISTPKAIEKGDNKKNAPRVVLTPLPPLKDKNGV